MPKVVTALRVCVSSILAMSLSRKRTSGAAVSHLNPITVHPEVPRWVPGGLGGSPMGRVCTPQSLLCGRTAGLQLCNGLGEIGNEFFACCWFVATSLSIVSFFWMDSFAKLSSNAAIFSAWTISCAAA